jgi:hypothetical protein
MLILSAFLSFIASYLAVKDSVPVQVPFSEEAEVPWRKQTPTNMFLMGDENGAECCTDAIRAIEKQEIETDIKLSRGEYQTAVFRILEEARLSSFRVCPF